MSNVVNDFHNFRAVSIFILDVFFEIYFDRDIMYLVYSILLKYILKFFIFHKFIKQYKYLNLTFSCVVPLPIREFLIPTARVHNKPLLYCARHPA